MPPDPAAADLLAAGGRLAIPHAVHPRRDIVVGGRGKLFVMGKAFAPGTYELFAPAIIALQKRSGPARALKEVLHAPREAGREPGDPPVYVMRTSAYTRASVHPFAMAAAMAGIGLASALFAASWCGLYRRA